MSSTIIVKHKNGMSVYEGALDGRLDQGCLLIQTSDKAAVIYAANQWQEVSITEEEDE